MAKKKELIHTNKTCGGVLQVLFTEDNIPYLECEKCEHKVEDWIKWEKEYKSYYLDKDKWSEKKDHLMCILSYFAFKYKEVYQKDYKMSLSEKGLFKSPEINVIRRVYSNLGSDALKVKDYIDWYFEFKIQRKKKKVTSISFLATGWALNEFEQVAAKRRKINRDTPLPKSLIELVTNKLPDIIDKFTFETFGDLNFIVAFNLNRGPGVDDSISRLIRFLEKKEVIVNNKIKGWTD